MQKKTNTIIPVLLTIIVMLLIFLITIVIMTNVSNKNSTSKETDNQKKQTTVQDDSEFELLEDPVLQAISYDDPNEIRYYVRTSFSNSASQVGAFHYFENAMNCADTHAQSGYEVYNIYGDLVYAPIIVNTTFYRVRTSANNATSQIGAFENIYNAIDLAEKNKNSGYKVYDDSGNLIYAPVISASAPIAPAAAPATKSASTTSSGNGSVLYRVRKSANDSDSQLGAFKDFNNAKNLAVQNKSAGYEVYDQNGNLVYAP